VTYDPFADAICVCGQSATVRLYVNYKYPRTEWLPEAGDPEYVHGGGVSFTTCGEPECEPDAFLACREELIDHHLLECPWISAEQMTALELQVALSPGDGMRILGGIDEDGL
jgi:hypothetical protein